MRRRYAPTPAAASQLRIAAADRPRNAKIRSRERRAIGTSLTLIPGDEYEPDCQRARKLLARMIPSDAERLIVMEVLGL